MVLMLLEQIVQLFLCIVLGWLLVRLHLLKPEDSRVLSKVCLYLVTPCVIINAFQLQRTPELLQGLALSLGAAIGIHALFFIATALLHRPLRLTPVEQASLIYTNSGNLIIPLVTAVLGPEWVIYCSMFQLVQQFPMWSHCRIILSGDRNVSLKKILLNVNIISVFVGVLLFLLNLPLPTVIAGTMKSIASHHRPPQHVCRRHAHGRAEPAGGPAHPQHLEGGLPAADRPAAGGPVYFQILWPCGPGAGRPVHPDDQPAGSKCPCGG